MRKIELNRETGRHLVAQLGRGWRGLPGLVLVRYRVAVEGLLLIIALVVIGVVGSRLIIFPEELPHVPMEPSIALRTALIDDLELWIEERDARRQQRLLRVRNDMFVTSGAR